MYDGMRKSNAHIFISLALIHRYGHSNIRAMDCWDYMECYLK